MLTPDEGHLDRRIAQEAGTLSRHGWQVDIYPAVDPNLDYEADLPPGVRLLPNPRSQVRSTGGRRGALRRGKRALSQVVPPVGRFIEAAQYRTRDIAREITDANVFHLLGLGRFDLVFAHDVPVMPLAAHLKTSWQARLISDLHEVFPQQDEHFTTATARGYWRALEAAGLAASDGIICVNQAVAEYVRDAHAPQAPIVVVLNSVPYVEASDGGPTLGSLYPIPDDVRVMLFGGSLRSDANLQMLIEGFSVANLDGWVLAILGDGPMQGELEAIVRDRGLGARVFLGRRVQPRDLMQVAASADIGLLPYLAIGFNHLIATPNKLFEYIQARLPIATSQLPQVERIVSVHGNGAFVDFSTAEKAGAGLAAFVRDVAPTITPASLEAAAREFSWEREEPALLDIVDRAMSGA
ncbi:MAG: glycosyltransferase [Chloroflexota bacterium]|nr:glycosyltransferase [Chloroflexota bacterium]